MSAKRSAIFAFVAAAVLLMVVAGCEGPEGPQGPAGPAGPSPIHILGWIESPSPFDSTSDVQVEVYNCPVIPSVEINDIQVPVTDPLYRRIPLRFSDNDFPISYSDSATLAVAYAKLGGNPGSSQANCMLPGSFEITSHDTLLDTISVGDSLVIHWTPSEGRDTYLIFFSLNYSYKDTSGEWKSFGFSYDSMFTDTSIIFSQTELFPNEGEIDTLIYGYGNFSVKAVNGPLQADEPGNVTGDGIGFFYGFTYGGSLRIFMEGANPLAVEAEEPKDIIKRFMEQRAKALNLCQK